MAHRGVHRAPVAMPPPGTSCPECPFVSDRTDIAARHLALAHYKLDAILQNQEAVSLKRKEYKIAQVSLFELKYICDETNIC